MSNLSDRRRGCLYDFLYLLLMLAVGAVMFLWGWPFHSPPYDH